MDSPRGGIADDFTPIEATRASASPVSLSSPSLLVPSSPMHSPDSPASHHTPTLPLRRLRLALSRPPRPSPTPILPSQRPSHRPAPPLPHPAPSPLPASSPPPPRLAPSPTPSLPFHLVKLVVNVFNDLLDKRAYVYICISVLYCKC
ncbi:hypothetical protein B0H13DRAFT_2327938 [Mycena leptocephala]|nr:hypothetical protein B0H13DRAFT_2327938 [Mycena leptocephala]